MTDDVKWSNKSVAGLLTLYRGMPSLWKANTDDYRNRNLRKQCYDQLIAYCKPMFPQADRDFVAKKIQSLRGTFRKEFKKVAASKRCGKGAEDVYVPSLWYYDLLVFTKDTDTPSASISNITEEETSLLDEAEELPEQTAAQDVEVHGTDDTDTQPHNQDEDVQPCGSTNKRPACEIHRCAKEKKTDDNVIEVLKSCAVALMNPTTSRIEISEYEASGIKVAKQLERMDPEQAIYADTIITAVLRRGLLKTLKPHTDLCDNECKLYVVPIREMTNFSSNNNNGRNEHSSNVEENDSRSY